MTANQATQEVITVNDDQEPKIEWIGPPQLVIVRAHKMDDEEFNFLSKTLNGVNKDKPYFYFIIIESEEDTKITFEYPLNHNLCAPPIFTLSNAKIDEFPPQPYHKPNLPDPLFKFKVPMDRIITPLSDIKK